MLNPTVNITAGDILRIPFVLPPPEIEKRVSELALDCIETKKRLNEYSIIETNYARSPLVAFAGQTLTERALNYLYHENDELTRVLQNEAEINELIFEVYALSPEDRAQVEAKMGVPVGSVALASVALALAGANTLNAPAEARATEADFLTLYQSNNDLEEFCVKRQLNPVDVSRWFRESGVLPPARAAEIALDFLTDAIRAVLLASPDGIVSLTAEGGEKRLLDRLEEHCVELGFSLAQFRQLEGLLGRGLDDYLQNHFFKNLSDRLNLFMYLPKTPFIWHVSSGEAGGFDAYLIIYKWTEDNLYKLKNRYLSNRTESLNFRLQDLSDVESAAAQTERETIRRQLQEIDSFAEKIDDLLASGYRPQLDDGVGKNIAPLQKRGMLRTEVLNKKQLEKYLNADW